MGSEFAQGCLRTGRLRIPPDAALKHRRKIWRIRIFNHKIVIIHPNSIHPNRFLVLIPIDYLCHFSGLSGQNEGNDLTNFPCTVAQKTLSCFNSKSVNTAAMRNFYFQVILYKHNGQNLLEGH